MNIYKCVAIGFDSGMLEIVGDVVIILKICKVYVCFIF